MLTLLLSCSEGDADGVLDTSGVQVELLTSDLTAGLDAAPSPSGDEVCYTDQAADGGEVVCLTVSLDEARRGRHTAGEPRRVVGGLGEPINLAFSMDGTTLFIADPQWPDADGGAIVAVPTAGGDAVAVAGTEGHSPTGLEIQADDLGEFLIFGGEDPLTGEAGLFRSATTGGGVTALATGFAEPAIGGVVVAADGVAYTAAYDAEGVGGAWRVDASGATLLATGFALGEPAGVALTPSGGALLVSSERADEYAQVVIIDLATGDTSTFDDVIGVNQGAGGLHRARDGELFAWIDRQCRTCAGGRVTSPKGTDSSQVYLVYGIE